MFLVGDADAAIADHNGGVVAVVRLAGACVHDAIGLHAVEVEALRPERAQPGLERAAHPGENPIRTYPTRARGTSLCDQRRRPLDYSWETIGA
jgi:hypothetical protein